MIRTALFLIIISAVLALTSPNAWAKTQKEADPLGYKLDPRHYDIFYGKCERIYLSGGDWKLKKLRKTEKNPTRDAGTIRGYMKPDHDDAKWPNQVVPWNWHEPYPETWEGLDRKTGKMRPFAGVGWYRKHFKIPAGAKGKRLLLHFGSVDQDCIVYVNGKKVGKHVQYMRYFASAKSYDIEQFEFDVTDVTKPGAENVLAVRVFDDGSGSAHKKNLYISKDVAGIWMPVVVRIESPVYARKFQIAPRIADSSISVKCTLINSGKKPVTLTPTVTITDYTSDRYKPKRESKPTAKTLSRLTLKPGKNTYSFTVKLNNPIYWSHEEPHLYLLKLSANEAGGTGIIGMERFGFREFTVSGAKFLLNGKPVRMRGSDRPSRYSGRRDIAANQDNINGKLTRFYMKDLNFNGSRCHKWPGRAFFNVTDELGHMLNSTCYPFLKLLQGQWLREPKGSIGSPPPMPIDLKTLKIDGTFYSRALEPWIAQAFNHPSIVMYNVANEPYDKPEFKKGPALAAARAVIKKLDPTRPCAAYSGRYPGRDKPVATDFWDVHDYIGSYCSMPYPKATKSLMGYYNGYVKAENKKLPMLNGECISPSWAIPGRIARKMGLKGKDITKISRTEYADAFEKLLADYKKNRAMASLNQIISLQNVTLQVAMNLEAGVAERAPQYKRMIEAHRWSDYCEGFNMHSPQLYPPLMGYRAVPKLAIRNACQPVLIGAELFDANVFADSRIKLNLRIVNDTLSPLPPTRARLALVAEGSKKTLTSTVIEIGKTAVGERKRIKTTCDVPPNLPTGRYILKMNLVDAAKEGASLSTNEYSIFVLGNADIRKSIRTKKRIGLALTKTEQAVNLIAIMKELGIRHRAIKDMKNLSKYDVIFMAGLRPPKTPGEHDKVHGAMYQIEKWINDGGRLVSIMQKSSAPIPGLPTSRILMSPHGRRPFGDIVVPKHPIFANIPQPCWDSWNGPFKGIFGRYISPLSEAVLVRGGVWRSFGMLLAEARAGKGLVLADQTLALEKYASDPVAKCYMQNLLAYTVGDEWDGKYAGTLRGKARTGETRTYKVESPRFISLRRAANRSFVDNVKLDRKGGWTDQGKYDLRHFPRGKQTFLGVPFNILGAKSPGEKSAIILMGQDRNYFPKEAVIRTNVYASRFFFLVTAAWCREGKHADIHINYEGGQGFAARRTIPLIRDKNIRDWTVVPDKELEGAAVAWHASHPVTGSDTHVYLIEWKNPEPNIKITHIKVESTGNGIPIILGITAETIKPK